MILWQVWFSPGLHWYYLQEIAICSHSYTDEGSCLLPSTQLLLLPANCQSSKWKRYSLKQCYKLSWLLADKLKKCRWWLTDACFPSGAYHSIALCVPYWDASVLESCILRRPDSTRLLLSNISLHKYSTFQILSETGSHLKLNSSRTAAIWSEVKSELGLHKKVSWQSYQLPGWSLLLLLPLLLFLLYGKQAEPGHHMICCVYR